MGSCKTACPRGWHLPTNEEWTQLEVFLKENGYSYDGIVGNGGIAKSLATDNGWTITDIQGAVGNSDFSDFRNKTGFSALPSGYRINSGNFYYLGDACHWWSATDANSISAYSRTVGYYGSEFFSNNPNIKSTGLSVRCIRD